jgi:hypothetical protein
MRAYPSTVITLSIAVPIGVLVFALALAGQRADQRESAAARTSAAIATTTTATAAPAAAGPITGSNNRVHPPPADVQLGGCTTHEYAGPAANGTLTNNSSKQSNYVISVNFADDAGVIVAQATAFPHDIPAGASATWEAVSFDDDGFATCTIAKVDRFSAVA